MKPSEAEAVVQALLMRDPPQQRVLRHKREEQARWQLERRKVAGVALAGYAAGAALASLSSAHWGTGGLLGCMIGSSIGRLWIWWGRLDHR